MFNRKRILWSVLGFVLTFATAVPAVAALRTATAAREVPVTTADLVGPVWEWTGLVQTLPAARLVVPSPDSYTLQFAGNGDCASSPTATKSREPISLRRPIID